MSDRQDSGVRDNRFSPVPRGVNAKAVTVSAVKRALGKSAPLVRDLVATGAAFLGVTNPRRRASRRLTVITFHRVLPADLRRLYPMPGLAVTPEELRWLLEYFTRHYRCGSLSQTTEEWLGDDISTLPLLAVTFDDGQLDNYEYARPVLSKLGLRASFYVPAAHIDNAAPLWHDRLAFSSAHVMAQKGGGRKLCELFGLEAEPSKQELISAMVKSVKRLSADERDRRIRAVECFVDGAPMPAWAAMMGWPEIETLANEGHEIGSHSMTHPILPQCDDGELEYEVAGSRALIQKRLNMDVLSFCYPNGSYDARVVQSVRKAGYATAVTTLPGINRTEFSPLQLHRFDMHPDHVRSRHGRLSEGRVALRLSGMHPGLS